MFRFATLRRPGTNTDHLRADPADTPSAADGPALRFARTPAEVIAAWDTVVRAAPRTQVLSATATTHHAVQRSAVFRFPDDIFAEAQASNEGTRLLIYSAARYGRGDFDVNARRVREWTAALIDALGR